MASKNRSSLWLPMTVAFMALLYFLSYRVVSELIDFLHGGEALHGMLLNLFAAALLMVWGWKPLPSEDSHQVIGLYGAFVAVCSLITAIWPSLTVIAFSLAVFPTAFSVLVIVFDLTHARSHRVG